eukprot:8501093-Pyramimonas_sp.AAC.1
MSRHVDFDTADFVDPAVAREGATLVVLQPIRPMSYAQASNMLGVVLRKYGGVADAAEWS